MATHSSVLAWRILGMGEPDGLPSMGLHRVGHDWSDLAAAASLIHDRYYTDFLVVLLNNIVRSTYLWNHMETLGWFGMKDIDLVCIMKYGWVWRKKKKHEEIFLLFSWFACVTFPSTDFGSFKFLSREIRFKKLKFITEFNGWLKQS